MGKVKSEEYEYCSQGCLDFKLIPLMNWFIVDVLQLKSLTTTETYTWTIE